MLTVLAVFPEIVNLGGGWNRLPSQTISLQAAVLGIAYILLLAGSAVFLTLHRRILVPLKEIEGAVWGRLHGDSRPITVHGAESGVMKLASSIDQLAQRFQRNLDELLKLVEQSKTGMLVVDAHGSILFANSPAARLMDQRAEALLGSQLGLPVGATDKAEIEINRGKGKRGVAELRSSSIEWNGKTAYLLAVYDVTERHHAEEAIRHQAVHDDLTGLPNRVNFRESLSKAMERAATINQGLAVLFIDLDRFKEVNDTLGHAAGDQLLRTVAGRLRGAVRSSDVVARMGGDEFTVLLEGVDDHETALKVGEKLRSAISAPMDVAARTLVPKATIGLSLYPEDGRDTSALLMRADTAMYNAKAGGRNRTQAFAVDQARAVSDRFWMEQALHQAQVNGEFRVFYQPQVTLPNGEPTDVEALLRWHHPEKGWIPPADFIPLLEEVDLIQPVGDWIFRQARADIERWCKVGLCPQRVWINISARQLASPDLVERIDELMTDTGLNPERFGIELTESGIAGHIEHSVSVVASLQKRGFRIAMDDFGTGYSALTFLRRLALDVVKIDRAFVNDIDDNDTACSLVRAIVAMSNALELQVVAEGVERASQADRLNAEGCRYAQGFWFARPMPPDELAEWWREFGQRSATSTVPET